MFYTDWMGSMLVRWLDTLLDWIERDRERHWLATLDDRSAEDVCVDRNRVASETEKQFWQT